MPSKKEKNLDLFDFKRVNLPDNLLGLLIRKQSNKDSMRRGNPFKKTKRVLSGSAL